MDLLFFGVGSKCPEASQIALTQTTLTGLSCINYAREGIIKRLSIKKGYSEQKVLQGFEPVHRTLFSIIFLVDVLLCYSEKPFKFQKKYSP
jgi:hypothetical protein